MPVEHFRSKGAEMRNLAWRHYHNVPYTAVTACVGTGKNERCHKVEHSKNPARRRIDSAQRRKSAKRKSVARHQKTVAKHR